MGRNAGETGCLSVVPQDSHAQVATRMRGARSVKGSRLRYQCPIAAKSGFLSRDSCMPLVGEVTQQQKTAFGSTSLELC